MRFGIKDRSRGKLAMLPILFEDMPLSLLSPQGGKKGHNKVGDNVIKSFFLHKTIDRISDDLKEVVKYFSKEFMYRLAYLAPFRFLDPLNMESTVNSGLETMCWVMYLC